MFTLLVLSVLLLFPYQAFAEKTLDPVLTLNFSDVESLMMARDHQILDNVKGYSNLNSGQGNVQSGTDNMNNLLVQLAGVGSAGDTGTLRSVLANLIQAQMQISVGTNSMAQRTNISAVGLQTEQGNYTIVWNMQKQYIAYNNNLQKLQANTAMQPLLEKKLAAVKLQKELGMVTDSDVVKAENDLKDLNSGINQLQQGILAIKQAFNICLAQPYDTAIQIGEVPEVTDDQIAAIQADNDYKEALKKAYGVKVEDINKDTDKKNDEIRKFQNSFNRAYQNILDTQKTLKIEQGKMAKAETDMKTADLKFKLGMLSSLQYESAKSTYAAEQAALVQAENALSQVYQQYGWAKRGLIVQ